MVSEFVGVIVHAWTLGEAEKAGTIAFALRAVDPYPTYKYKRSDGEEDWSSYCRLGRADLM